MPEVIKEYAEIIDELIDEGYELADRIWNYWFANLNKGQWIVVIILLTLLMGWVETW